MHLVIAKTRLARLEELWAESSYRLQKARKSDIGNGQRVALMSLYLETVSNNFSVIFWTIRGRCRPIEGQRFITLEPQDFGHHGRPKESTTASVSLFNEQRLLFTPTFDHGIDGRLIHWRL